MLLVPVLVGGCGDEAAAPPSDTSSDQSAGDLWGRSFVSTAITEGGEPQPLVRDTRIEVAFGDEVEQGVLGWKAGCNDFGAPVKITTDRLLVGQVTGTEMGCSDDLEEQDDWLMRFFQLDPTWRLSDERLTLSSGKTVVELKESGPSRQ